jgi:integrase
VATIKQQGKGYKITVSLGYDINGKQLRDHMTWIPEPGMTKRQIEKELTKQAVLFEEKCVAQNVHGGSIKLSDFAEQWFKDYAEKQVKQTTIDTYRTFMPRINAALGHIRLDKLQPKHILAFYAELDREEIRLDTKYQCTIDLKTEIASQGFTQMEFCKKANIGHGTLESACAGRNISKASADKICTALEKEQKDIFQAVSKGKLSGKTRLHYHRFLSILLETAVQWQMISGNPCRRVKAPRVESNETSYLDEEQAAALVSALDSAPIKYRAMILLLLNTGLRRGELCALSWDDIDFDKAVLSVRKNAVYRPGVGVFITTPKTKQSLRSIKLPASTIPMLKQYRAHLAEQRISLGDLWEDNNLVFPGQTGKPMRPDTLTNWFSKFAAKHGLPHVTIHGLRHTNATLLIAAGTNLRTVAGRLGHAQSSTTANIYAHAIKSADAAAAEVLETVLFRSGKKAQ